MWVQGSRVVVKAKERLTMFTPCSILCGIVCGWLKWTQSYNGFRSDPSQSFYREAVKPYIWLGLVVLVIVVVQISSPDGEICTLYGIPRAPQTCLSHMSIHEGDHARARPRSGCRRVLRTKLHCFLPFAIQTLTLNATTTPSSNQAA